MQPQIPVFIILYCTIVCKSDQQSSSGNVTWRSRSTISYTFSNCEYRGLLMVYDYMFRRIASSSGRQHNSTEDALLLIFYKFAGTYASFWTFRTTCIEIREGRKLTVFLQHIAFFISFISHVYLILTCLPYKTLLHTPHRCPMCACVCVRN